MNIKTFIQAALAEDLGIGDHTSLATIPESKKGKARLLVKEEGILAGIELAVEIFNQVDSKLQINKIAEDGDFKISGDIAFTVEGNIRSILISERLVLNCMQRMSGIATTTRRYVDAVSGYNAKIMDTRKTTPLMRTFEKWAVAKGGGYNHRFGLYDMILIKDNHIDSCGGIKEALERSREYLSYRQINLPIEVETRSIKDVEIALSTGIPNRIMFDNFTISQTSEAVKLVNGVVETESSGGITLLNVRDYASTGVNFISVGALTHSVKSLDLSLKIFE
jgi:nicotinate-nucleotide pyrophosphorylase (carboxylating)